MTHIQEALKLYGQKEIIGEKDNPEIIRLFDELGFNGNQLKDETSWCAAFANCILKRAGKPYLRKLNARSLLQIGNEVECPQLGDIVIFWRESRKSWMGHVGFYISEDENYINVLGGNQSNKVCISPYFKGRVLGYRRV
ncbi:TIGR02594 family protein [Thalassobellus suaedae]|uniref:TIGR02594 family protein n=1 Tax=Thalassobellus suaedae TaxID=3074124 RepID=A0ABY9XW77_9FLAO|nr:TIGR02594 family protein [Flavobacteriaceae bacterium HL-DH14]